MAMVRTTQAVALKFALSFSMMAPITMASPASSITYSKMMNSARLNAARGPRMCFACAYWPPAEATVELTSESIMATQE